MAKQVTKKNYNTFVKGLVTEASPLTFPENASLDEDNCVLYRKGNRSRRLGIDFTDASYGTFGISLANIQDFGMTDYEWSNVNNKSNLNFLVHQSGITLHFFDQGVENLHLGYKAFTVNLTAYIAPGVDLATATANIVSMTSGKGHLFVSGESISPILVVYDEVTDTVTVKPIYVLIRDLQGLDDGLANDEEPTTLSAAHHYNLLNQGWTQSEGASATVSRTYYSHYGVFGTTPQATYNALQQTVITKYFQSVSRYPANNKQWWVGKSTDQVFDPNVLNRSYWGTTLAPKGHFVVNAFYIDRSAVSGVSGIAVESTIYRPISVAFFSGRVWYLNQDTIYFSQLLDKKGSNAGFCFQDQDPTAETLNELVATDGGVIPLPELGKGVRLEPVGQGLLVFGTKGVWFISGTTAGFTATEITVAKVSSVGTDAPESIISVEGKIFWMSKTGIQGLAQQAGAFGPAFGSFDQSNISLSTIQTFYVESIPDSVRIHVKAVHDKTNNIIQWLFRTEDVPYRHFYNRILNFDLALQAFYPWTISTGLGIYIVGVFSSATYINVDDDENVTNGGATVTSGGLTVTTEVESVDAQPSFIKYVCAYPDGAYYGHAFAAANNTLFRDWEERFGGGEDYTSFVETGYEILQSPTQKKQTPYVYCFFRQTETEYTLVGVDYALLNKSSCTFRVKWDWSNSAVSNKWSAAIEAYRLKRLPPIDPSDLDLITGFPVVVTKNKVRGSGRALTFRFECSTAGRDFDLLGWSVDYNVSQLGSN